MQRMESVILYVEDLERSIGFYRDVLGLPLSFSEHGYAELRLENVKLGLFEFERAEELTAGPRPPAGASEILFVVEDVDAVSDRLRELGVRWLRGPVDHPWGHRSVHIADPDGHVIELAQEIPRSRPRGG